MHLGDTGVESVVHRVLSGEADFGIGPEREPAPPLDARLLFEMPFALVFPKGHELEKQARVTWKDVARYPLISLQGQFTERLLDALDWGATTIIVVSDGVENDPPNTFHAALSAAKKLVPGLTLLHFNPVFDAEMLTVQNLSELAPAVGLRDADDLPTALSFARFAAGQSKLSELEMYLEHRVQTFLTEKKEVNHA